MVFIAAGLARHGKAVGWAFLAADERGITVRAEVKDTIYLGGVAAIRDPACVAGMFARQGLDAKGGGVQSVMASAGRAHGGIFDRRGRDAARPDPGSFDADGDSALLS